MPVAKEQTRGEAADPAASWPVLRVAAEQAIAAYAEDPGDPAVVDQLVACRRAAAKTIAAWSPARKAEGEIAAILDLLRVHAGAGVSDLPATREDVALAEACRSRGWPGLLAALVLVPAWQWRGAPALDEVPGWLWASYTAYLFHAPQGFVACGQAAEYGRH